MIVSTRRHLLSDCCREHWKPPHGKRVSGCEDCARAERAAKIWRNIESAIGRPLGPRHRLQIVHIIAEPLGLRGAHDPDKVSLGRPPEVVAEAFIRGLAFVFAAATGTRAEVSVRHSSEDVKYRGPGFEAFLLAIRKNLKKRDRLQNERMFLRMAFEVVKGKRATGRRPKARPTKLRLQNVSPVTLNGIRSGDVFWIAGIRGKPIDQFWAARLKEGAIKALDRQKIAKWRSKSATY